MSEIQTVVDDENEQIPPPAGDENSITNPADKAEKSKKHIGEAGQENPDNEVDDVKWNSDNVDVNAMIEKFGDVNKSIVDKNAPFWWVVFSLFIVVLGLLVWGIIAFFTQDPIDVVGNCLYSSRFWYAVVQKIGFIICLLLVFLPILRLFCDTVRAINQSQEEKSFRMTAFLRFVYVLKYKGKIDSEMMRTLSKGINIVKTNDSQDSAIISDDDLKLAIKHLPSFIEKMIQLVRK